MEHAPASQRPGRVELSGSLVFTVMACSVFAGAIAGVGYWFFSRLVDGWGLHQRDFLADFGLDFFGMPLVHAANTPPAAALTFYGYMVVAPLLGAAAGAVMGLLAVDARRGAGHARSPGAHPAVGASAAVVITASVTALYLYPVVQSLLPVAYMGVIGGGGLLAGLLWCGRAAGVAR